MRSQTKRGFTLIELLVVIAIIAILASILFPVFSKAREKARQATCTSQVRQIATAIQMYTQDNSAQYPGVDNGNWPDKLTNYLGSSQEMFQCPSDTAGTDGQKVSYAMAGVLIRQDGSGVKEASVKSPSEVGVICDASPSETYSMGRLIGGGGLKSEADWAATPEPRHNKGIVAGFCDGHAKYVSGSFDPKDMGSDITRAFYAVASLGLVDNPLGCLNSDATPLPTVGTSVTVGGEYATYPLLMAAARAGVKYYTRGFNGENDKLGRPTNGNYVWGTASGAPIVNPATTATSAIAFDAVCVIVAKSSKIPTLPTFSNDTYLCATGFMRTMLMSGYVQNSVQVYKMSDNCSTSNFIKSVMSSDGVGTGFSFGPDTVQATDDLEMVEKVANDPYGIGYCSTVFADPERVTILAIQDTKANKNYFWPSASTKFRWVVPAKPDTANWPWIRALNLQVSSPTTDANAIKNALQTGNLIKAMYNGPLFKIGYWMGNY